MTVEYFDQWFADIARSDARQDLYTLHLGVPPEIGPSNVLPLYGLQEVARELRLSAERELVDLGCGRGGPGMWIARESGADLIGIDFSAEAIEQASQRRSSFGLDERASFAIGTLDATGLSAGVADAVVCVDAIQFSNDGVATAAEVRRILRPGGRFVLTTWQPVDPGDETLSERLRAVDVAGWLDAAGFTDVVITDRAQWHEDALRMWQAAVELDPGDDPAMESTVAEAHRSVGHHDRLRRILATATAP
jgi:SAM-dependent methyltransferase